MKHFDLIVIGGGPGGYVAALHAAKLSKTVALFEQSELGGTCLNRGCIPTKALLRSSRVYHEAVHGAELGVITGSVDYDINKMHAKAMNSVETLRLGIQGLIDKAKIELINKRATIVDKNTVKAGGESFTADKILIATGSRPSMPPITGVDSKNVHTSDYFLQNPVDCKSLIIVGGGVIGVEFAQVYNRLGCEVTIIEAMPRLLPLLEREVGQSLNMIFKKREIATITGASVVKIENDEDFVQCTYSLKNEEITIKADKMLVCTGRVPNTDNLFEGDISPEMQRGFIAVDENLESSVKGIYAIGDVVLGSTQLAHAAEAQAANFVSLNYENKLHKNMSLIPACVFTEPEIACVGLNTDEAKAKGINAKSVKKLTSSNGKSVIEDADRGFVKLCYDAETKVLLGATLMCHHAGEMIGGITCAIENKLSVEDLEKTIFPHPTVSETLIS